MLRFLTLTRCRQQLLAPTVLVAGSRVISLSTQNGSHTEHGSRSRDPARGEAQVCEARRSAGLEHGGGMTDQGPWLEGGARPRVAAAVV